MNIAVLGLGFMGSTHLKALKAVRDARVLAVVSSDEKKLSGDLTGIQGNIGGPGEKMDFSSMKKYHTVAEALCDAEVEAVDICLPTHLHAPVALEALRAGKHVLVEKPMALDGASADEMLAEAKARKRVLMTGQVLRFVPSYTAMAEAVKSGRLGQARAAIFRRRCAAPDWSTWLGNAEQSGGGVFDLLIHDVDFCVHLFGIPRAVSAVGYEVMGRGIDWILAQLDYPELGTVAISGGWHHPKAFPFSMEFTVICDRGTLEYNSAGTPLALYSAEGERRALETPDKDWFTEELRYFVDCARNGRPPERCSPEESAMAVKVARWMVESRSRNGERIECKL